jgi:hypothetical protein
MGLCVCRRADSVHNTPIHAWPGIVTQVRDGETERAKLLQGGEAHKVRLPR